LVAELDYEREARFTTRIRRNLSALPRIFVPEVIDELCTVDVIATEMFVGHRIDDTAKMRELAVEPREVLDIIISAWVKMMYEDGVFQSDPHPGNMLFRVTKEGLQVCILDFGQVKELPDTFRSTLIDAVLRFMARDARGFEACLVNLGMLRKQDAEAAGPFLVDFFDNYFHLSPEQARALDFDALRKQAEALLHRIEGVTIPNDVVLHARTISLLAGLSTALDESRNLFVAAQPHVMRAMLNRFSTRSVPAPT
jgi:predicted unusual protein kinase regulating ubiquinone biosynthesis (AarF/ABC1/UbiB family)